MSAKKLEPKSRYAEYDTDGDGIVSDEELAKHQEMLQLELQEEKADSQRKMAWVAMVSMCVFAVLPLAPFVPADRLSTLASLSDMLFLSQASIIGLYFGATAYMARKQDDFRIDCSHNVGCVGY